MGYYACVVEVPVDAISLTNVLWPKLTFDCKRPWDYTALVSLLLFLFLLPLHDHEKWSTARILIDPSWWQPCATPKRGTNLILLKSTESAGTGLTQHDIRTILTNKFYVTYFDILPNSASCRVILCNCSSCESTFKDFKSSLLLSCQPANASLSSSLKMPAPTHQRNKSCSEGAGHTSNI